MEVQSSGRRRCEIQGVRYIFAIIGFFGFVALYAIRVNINVAIVAMVNTTAIYEPPQGNLSSDQCKAELPGFLKNDTSYIPQKIGDFLWTSEMQGVILGAFYYGYCVSQIPGGRMAEIFSGKWVFGIGTLVTALLTLLTPLAAQYHVGLLITVRVLEGLAQGVTMPAMHSMLGRWIPDSEKSILNSLVYSGINIGTVFSMPLTGFLCNSNMFNGWPSAFYVVGVYGCFWFLLWSILVTDSPLKHPFISQNELNYILTHQKFELRSELPPIPWKKILTSKPFLALVITQIGQDWVFYTMINDLPTFFSTVLNVKVDKTGYLTAYPYLLSTAVSLVVAFVADALVAKGIVSTNFVRKFCNSASGFGFCLGLIGVCIAECNVKMTAIFFALSISIGGFCYSGYMLNHLDLSPEYAGSLMGISNTISNLTGFLAPLVVGAITNESHTIQQWRIVFYITIAILVLTSLIFVFFATTEKQNWAEPENTPTNDFETSKKQFYGSINA